MRRTRFVPSLSAALATALATALAATLATTLIAPRALFAQLAPATATLDEEFTQITSIRELADGRVLISDGSEKRIVVADLRTGRIRQLGRIGTGPAEYETPGRFYATRGDSTLMQDQGNTRRWLVFVGDSIVTILPLDHPTIAATGGSLGGADARGFVLARRPGPLTDLGGGRATVYSALMRVELATGRADSIGRVQGMTLQSRTTGPVTSPRTMNFQLVFSVQDLTVLFPDGWVAIVRSDPYRVDWQGPTGPAVGGAPIPHVAVKATDAEKQYWHDMVNEDAGSTRPFDISMYPFAEYVAPFRTQGGFATPEGSLLLLRGRSSEAPGNDYDVIDRNGRRVRALHIPRNQRIVGFGTASVYVSVRDADGIERLRRHPWPAPQR